MNKQLHILINFSSQLLMEELANELNLQRIAIPEIFREALTSGDEIGKKIQECFDNGELVPDETVNELVAFALEKYDSDVLLIGYPRTIEQHHLLMKT